MKLKNVLIICAIVLAVIVGVLMWSNSKQQNVSTTAGSNELLENSDEGIGTQITITSNMSAGIKELYIKEVGEGAPWYEYLNGDVVDGYTSIILVLDNYSSSKKWKFKVVDEYGTVFDFNEEYGSDIIYDGANLSMGLYMTEDQIQKIKNGENIAIDNILELKKVENENTDE